ncbi:MAG: T9SS type A sorting domain-containing protein [Owenweeksia sp.]|nr:T9SS type A sorting domain-containing protein [Owenweeksia sp.]
MITIHRSVTNTALNTIERSISIAEVYKGFSTGLFEAYPNPTSGSIWVELQNGYGEAAAELIDLNGRIIIATAVGQREELNLNHLPKGVYILQISTEREAQQKRIIIE